MVLLQTDNGSQSSKASPAASAKVGRREGFELANGRSPGRKKATKKEKDTESLPVANPTLDKDETVADNNPVFDDPNGFVEPPEALPQDSMEYSGLEVEAESVGVEPSNQRRDMSPAVEHRPVDTGEEEERGGDVGSDDVESVPVRREEVKEAIALIKKKEKLGAVAQTVVVGKKVAGKRVPPPAAASQQPSRIARGSRAAASERAQEDSERSRNGTVTEFDNGADLETPKDRARPTKEVEREEPWMVAGDLLGEELTVLEEVGQVILGDAVPAPNEGSFASGIGFDGAEGSVDAGARNRRDDGVDEYGDEEWAVEGEGDAPVPTTGLPAPDAVQTVSPRASAASGSSKRGASSARRPALSRQDAMNAKAGVSARSTDRSTVREGGAKKSGVSKA